MIYRILIIITVSFVFPIPIAEAGEPFYATVKRVIDGDSLLVTSGGREVEIRLYGIDAPEHKQPFAAEAKIYVKHWVGRQPVMVQPEDVDRYGRTVAMIVRGDQVLNSDLVRAGLAWVYPRYCRKDVCKSWKELESAAHSGKSGLWHDRQPISPWQWRELENGR